MRLVLFGVGNLLGEILDCALAPARQVALGFVSPHKE